LLFAIVGLGLFIFIAINYGKGKKWGKIWMLILSYLSIVLLIKSFVEMGKIPNYRGLRTWTNIGAIIDVVCFIAIVIVIIRVHGNKSNIGAPTAAEPGETSGSELPPPPPE